MTRPPSLKTFSTRNALIEHSAKKLQKWRGEGREESNDKMEDRFEILSLYNLLSS